MLYLAIAVWTFLLVRIIIASINLFTRQWLRPGDFPDEEMVSVLIPARNEQHTIGRLLDSIIGQEYTHWEVIVYDDLSTDDTSAVVLEYAEQDSRIRLISGRELPEGWLGKNHACHRLAEAARGRFFLFVDADVVLGSTLIRDALAHMERHRLDLLSIFPQQIMKSWGERISVPVMNWVLVSLLPLILTRVSSNPAFAAANGQHMLFRAARYKEHQFHRQVKQKAVEDIAIARYLKRHGMRLQTLLSGGQVTCRMYASLKEALHGFSKNVLAFFGNNPLVAILIVLITTVGVVPLYLSMGVKAVFLYFLFTLVLRMIVSAASKQNILHNVVTAPLQQLVFCTMVATAIYKRTKRRNTWKGRTIHT
ncbi:MAG: glycosyltransferase family 2 protein [Bacteroidales bacterium]|nr:glycosyltransferase family 2 protein [Bacteroidales bacterium]